MRARWWNFAPIWIRTNNHHSHYFQTDFVHTIKASLAQCLVSGLQRCIAPLCVNTHGGNISLTVLTNKNVSVSSIRLLFLLSPTPSWERASSQLKKLNQRYWEKEMFALAVQQKKNQNKKHKSGHWVQWATVMQGHYSGVYLPLFT